MNPSSGSRGFAVVFLLACATITWSSVKQDHDLPHPSRFKGAALTYGILGFVAPFIGVEFALLLGVGFYLVLLYRYYNGGSEGEGTTSSGEDQQVKIGQSIGRILD